jgi:zinc protease
MPTIVRTEIDGVPTIWSPAPGPLTAALVFRIGRADERPVDGGITHLVEHLAMAPLGQPRYDHNAFVEGNRTVFFASGRPDEVTTFFDVVTRALRDIPLERLQMEREVLRRESEGREGSIVDVHRHVRFGLAGHGLVGQPEFGLSTLDGSGIDGWSKFAFTRGNAMLWMTGEPPTSLRLDLLDGERRVPPAPQTIPYLNLPSHIGAVPGFGLGFMSPRRRGAGTFLSILQRRLRQRLRLEQGLVYDVMASYEPLDADEAVGMIGTDCAPDQVDLVTDVTFDELENLINGKATGDELADELADLERAANDPTAVASLLDVMARDELLGMPARSPDERYEEQARTSAADVSEHAAGARSTAILMADTGRLPRDFTAYPLTSPDSVSGREVKPLLSVLGIGRRQRLTIGDEGVTLRSSDGVLTTIRYQDCVLLERPADDEIVLWDRDGDRIYIPAIYWRSGGAVLAEIAAALPADILIEEKISYDLID